MTSRLSVIFSRCSPFSAKGLNVPSLLNQFFNVSIFVFSFRTSVQSLPFCWDCKGRNLFCFCKSFLILFSGLLNPYASTLLLPLFQINLTLQTCSPCSQAGCKSRKIFTPSKYFIPFFLAAPTNSLSLKHKNVKVFQTNYASLRFSGAKC